MGSSTFFCPFPLGCLYIQMSSHCSPYLRGNCIPSSKQSNPPKHLSRSASEVRTGSVPARHHGTRTPAVETVRRAGEMARDRCALTGVPGPVLRGEVNYIRTQKSCKCAPFSFWERQVKKYTIQFSSKLKHFCKCKYSSILSSSGTETFSKMFPLTTWD